MNYEKVKELIRYFEKEPFIILAFLFGSKVKDPERKISDWDIGIYFLPKKYMETETEEEYEEEKRIWFQIVDILKTDNIDLVILNRARSVIVYNVLRAGIPLVIKDRKLYLDLLCKVSYEAIDFWNFASDYFKMSENPNPLSPEERTRVLEYIRFLENEFSELKQIKEFGWEGYVKDSFKRKIIERWVENLVMSALDIAKIFLISEKREIPQTYKDILKIFGSLYINNQFGEMFSWFASLRNVLVHEYLDIKWKRIEKFIKDAEELFPIFISKVKEIVVK
jgi:uncharacterized protein YutE (UPF0331/DUF86 family)/predicted nucleotidyltransferase